MVLQLYKRFIQPCIVFSVPAELEKGQGRSNCETLFGIGKIPSDNYIRDMFDGADPTLLRPCFERMEQLLAMPPLRQVFAKNGRLHPDRLESVISHCAAMISHCFAERPDADRV